MQTNLASGPGFVTRSKLLDLSEPSVFPFIHSFIPEILIEHLLCARPVLSPGDTAMNKLTSWAYILEGEIDNEKTEKVKIYTMLDSADH